MGYRFLTSMMTVGVLLPEFGWNLDFFLRLVAGFDAIGINAIGNMFESHYMQLFKLFSFLDYYGHSRLHFSTATHRLKLVLKPEPQTLTMWSIVNLIRSADWIIRH